MAGAIALASGDLAQVWPQVADQNLRRLRADLEGFGDHRHADEGGVEEQRGEARQGRAVPASPALPRQKRFRQHQAVVLRETLPRGGVDDRQIPVQVFDERRSSVRFWPQEAEAKGEAQEMRFCAAAAAQIKPGEQRGEPRLALDRFGLSPASRQKQSAEERRQGVGLRKTGAPGGEDLGLVQTLVIEKSVAVRRRGIPLKDRVGGARRRGEVRQGRVQRIGVQRVRARILQRTRGTGNTGHENMPDQRVFGLAVPLPCLALGRPGRPSEQAQNSRRGEQKFGITRCGLPAQAEVLLRPDEGVGRGADVHAGIVEDEVVEGDELPLGPEGGAGLRGIGSGEDAGADGRGAQPLVEAGESIVGGRQRPDEVGERGGAKREGAGRWDRGGPGGPGFGGHRGSRCGTGKYNRINNNKSLTQVNKLCHCLTRTPPIFAPIPIDNERLSMGMEFRTAGTNPSWRGKIYS